MLMVVHASEYGAYQDMGMKITWLDLALCLLFLASVVFFFLNPAVFKPYPFLKTSWVETLK